MPDWITGWLDRLPARQLALVVCAFFVGITWLGILLVHPLMRRLLHREEPSNELIIHIAGTFGLVYAVLLGLLTVATFQNTKDLQDDVGREASSLSTIYRTTDAYPEPLRSELKAQLRDYTHYVIDKDWPAHRKGIVPMGGEHRLQAIRAQLMSFEPATKTQEVLHSELLRYLDAMTVQREQRLASVTAASPNLRWPRKPGDIGFGRRACGGCGRQAVLNHVAELRTLNPALGRLRPRDMIKTPRYD